MAIKKTEKVKKKTTAVKTLKTGKKTSASKPKSSDKKTARAGKIGTKKAESPKALKVTKKAKTPETAVMAKKGKVSSQEKESKGQKKLSQRERELQEIKKKLIHQKNALLSEAEEALNSLPGQTIFPDLGDQASAEIDRNFMLRLRGREQRLLKKIEEAIEKIDLGAFGICEVCGQEINIKRLYARPVTTMCICCKTEQEEEEKVRGG